AIFEAVHGSAPDIAGQNLANPLALVMSGVMMLNHIGQRDKATRIKDAYNQVLTKGDPSVLTPDIGGRGGTRQFADAVCELLG
ncbi:MAG: isocitrate/isopropylmalate family dehydrogenase, partial [Acidobacteriota bacterium]|nr:isocitrate/isopropylmalate family dehydrogenase [Acidobacteriota bacterium]